MAPLRLFLVAAALAACGPPAFVVLPDSAAKCFQTCHASDTLNEAACALDCKGARRAFGTTCREAAQRAGVPAPYTCIRTSG